MNTLYNSGQSDEKNLLNGFSVAASFLAVVKRNTHKDVRDPAPSLFFEMMSSLPGITPRA